jgi:hypothetical protein
MRKVLLPAPLTLQCPPIEALGQDLQGVIAGFGGSGPPVGAQILRGRVSRNVLPGVASQHMHRRHSAAGFGEGSRLPVVHQKVPASLLGFGR